MFALMIDRAMAADGEEPGLEVFLALEVRRVFGLLQPHEPDESLLHHITRPLEIVQDTASIAHERPFVACEQRGDVDGRHMGESHMLYGAQRTLLRRRR